MLDILPRLALAAEQHVPTLVDILKNIKQLFQERTTCCLFYGKLKAHLEEVAVEVDVCEAVQTLEVLREARQTQA